VAAVGDVAVVTEGGEVGSGVGNDRSVGGLMTIVVGDEGGTALGSSERTKSSYSSIARSLLYQLKSHPPAPKA
jgi:hypothetical protein